MSDASKQPIVVRPSTTIVDTQTLPGPRGALYTAAELLQLAASNAISPERIRTRVVGRFEWAPTPRETVQERRCADIQNQGLDAIRTSEVRLSAFVSSKTRDAFEPRKLERGARLLRFRWASGLLCGVSVGGWTTCRLLRMAHYDRSDACRRSGYWETGTPQVLNGYMMRSSRRPTLTCTSFLLGSLAICYRAIAFRAFSILRLQLKTKATI
jgi:hypothetical protein